MKLALKGHGGVEETAGLAGTQKASTQRAGPGTHAHVQVTDGMQCMAQQVQGTAHPIGQAVRISVRDGGAACVILKEFLIPLKVWSKSGLQLHNFSNNWGQSASRRAVRSCIGAVVAPGGRSRSSRWC